MSNLIFLIDGADEPERQARLRELRALALIYCGRSNAVTTALGKAIADSRAIPDALQLLDTLPALRRRWLLAAYAALMSRGGL